MLFYMNETFFSFGFNVVSSLELHFRPGKMLEKNKIQNQEKTIKAFDRFVARIEEGGRDNPPLNMLVPFSIFKYVSEIDKETMQADYEYYKDKTDYYYETKIPFVKKMITKRAVKKIVSGFD